MTKRLGNRSVRLAVLVVATLSCWAGCGGLSNSTKLENALLESKLAQSRAQARRDRRRLRDLQNEIVVLKSTSESSQARAEDDWEGPELPVEVRAPEAADAERVAYAGIDADGTEVVYVGEAADDTTAIPRLDRYDLRASGSVSSRRAAPPISAPEATSVPEERLGVTPGSIPKVDSQLRQARSPMGVTRNRHVASPREEYKRYYAALQAGNHAYAVTGFRNFVARFPEHDHADNAQYWLGEAFYDQKQFKAAIVEFQKVVDNFSRGNKVPDALLKLGYCHFQLGNKAAGEAALRMAVERFPTSQPAVLATRKLKQLGR